MQQSAAQIMHGEKQSISDHIELIWGGFRLYPLGCEVQIINCAVNVANDAIGKDRSAFLYPSVNSGKVIFGQSALTMRFDLSIAHVDNGNLIHLNTSQTIFCVYAKHGGTVFTNTKVLVW
jgi:hypothetical protein